MRDNNSESIEIEPIFIGKIIEEELRRQERTVTWLSRKIHCDRRNIYDIFSRTSIDTDLLYKLSIALHKDFFAYFSTNLQLINNQIFTPPHATTQPTITAISNSAYIIEPIGHNNTYFDQRQQQFVPASKATGTLTNTRNSNSENPLKDNM